MTCVIINDMMGIQYNSYLELGVSTNENFNRIRCSKKFSVDTNGNAMFTGTTDEFFKSIDKATTYDIIFIDANHDIDYLVRDFNNSIKHCNKWIIIHDMIPPEEFYCAHHLCSDSYKMLYFLLREKDFFVYPMDSNFGLTFIKMPVSKIELSSSYKQTSYSDFNMLIESTKLYNNKEITKILNGENPNV